MKNKGHNFFSRLGTGKERDYFIENLTMMLAAGMDIYYALEAIKKEIIKLVFPLTK